MTYEQRFHVHRKRGKNMERELFLANQKEVRALGLKVDCAPSDLHVYVNGVDLAKIIPFEEVRITSAKESEAAPVAIIVQQKQ
jgi:hypothetical protein